MKVKQIVQACGGGVCKALGVGRRGITVEVLWVWESGEGFGEHACSSWNPDVKLSFLQFKRVSVVGSAPEERAKLVQEPVACMEWVM